MFVENEKNSQFAIEFKKSYIELINELKNMWGDYDFKMGVGDPYAFPEYSKEEIMAMNDDLMNSISQLVLNLSSNFKYKEYHDFIYSIFTYLAKNYEKIRWLSNEIDFALANFSNEKLNMNKSTFYKYLKFKKQK